MPGRRAPQNNNLFSLLELQGANKKQRERQLLVMKRWELWMLGRSENPKNRSRDELMHLAKG